VIDLRMDDSSSSSSDSEASVTELRNPAEDKSKSKEKQQKTVAKHFQDYLIYRRENEMDAIELNSIYELMSDHAYLITEEMIGKFGGYLEDVKKFNNIGTVLYYVSGLRAILEQGLGYNHSLFQGRFFARLRENMEKSYGLKGKKKTKKKAMTINDFKCFCKILFERNTTKSLMDRALITMQWQIIGRINETFIRVEDVEGLQNGDLNGILLNIKRHKTGNEMKLIVVPHPTDYRSCMIHALASWVLLGKVMSAMIFPRVFVGKECGSNYTNKMLEELRTEAINRGCIITEGLKSHSVRKGGASYLNSLEGINQEDIKRRGGWKIEKKDRVNLYIEYFEANDFRIAKSLSEWGKTKFGGQAYQLEWIPENERLSFLTYSNRLIGFCGFDDFTQLRLTMSLLHYYNEIKEAFPSHTIIRIMESKDTKSKLEEWSATVKSRFRQINYIDCLDSSSKGGPLYDQLEEILTNQRIMQSKTETIEDVLHKVSSRLESKMESILTGVVEAVASVSITSELPIAQSTQIERAAIIPAMFNPRPMTREAGVLRNEISLPASDKLEVSTLFSQWYIMELYKINPANLTAKEEENFNHYKEVLAYSKCLLPAQSTIPMKPTDSAGIKQWQKEITSMGIQVNDEWKKLREEYKPTLEPQPIQPDKKKRKTNYNPTISNVRKLRPQLQSCGVVFDFTRTIDDVTPVEMKYESVKHRRYNRNRK
jgi:hypothetical protein